MSVALSLTNKSSLVESKLICNLFCKIIAAESLNTNYLLRLNISAKLFKQNDLYCFWDLNKKVSNAALLN